MPPQLQLPDGRVLDYSVSGAENGFPLLFLHGTPGASGVFSDLEIACKNKSLKLITASRPGYSGSTRHRGRRVVDVVQDLKYLLEHLKVERCVVAGWSGGGPHALACAAQLPGCVAALLIAGLGPCDGEGLDFLQGQGEGNVVEFNAAIEGEESLRKHCEVGREGMTKGEDVNAFVMAISSILPDVDKATLLGNMSFGSFLIEHIKEALKITCDGWIDDDLAFVKPWGFGLEEIQVPVLLYQGSEDRMVPFAHGEWLVKSLPEGICHAHLLQGEGHLSLVLGQLDAMIDEIRAYC